MKTAYFDCFAGVAGDMTLGALVDLGVDAGVIDAAVRAMGVTNFALEVAPARRCGIGGTKVDVRGTGAQPERHLKDIEAILDGGALKPEVREPARRVFRRLAEAESRVHRVPVERVHLHEVGALDAIVDVVGSCAGLHALGVERVVASPLVLGRGMTRGEHGPMPVPAPATLELVRDLPVREGPVEAEMTTPTGAALLATLATSFGPMPALRVLGIGYGAGTRSFEALPNMLRIVLGEEAGADEAEEGTAVLIEASLDDLSPQVLAYAESRLLAAGALDVWTQPAAMKKGRAGQVLSVLAPPDLADALARIVFAETSTIGVRFSDLRRRMLARTHVSVDTAYGPIRVKVARLGAEVVNALAEYEDCAAAAARAGVPLKEVQAAALVAWRGGGASG